MMGQEEISHADGLPQTASGQRSRPGTARAAKVAACVLLTGLLGFVGGFAGFSYHVAELATPADPGDADAIVVLTGGQSRLGAAVDLLKSGKGSRLLISGVHPAAGSGDLQNATGGDAALFNCCVDIDYAALDTIGNAEESAKWAANHNYDRIIVVTNNYHMPRSLLEMRRHLSRAVLVPYPVVNTRLDGGGWMTKPDAVRVLFTEYAKYLAAVVRGLMPLAAENDPVEVVNASVAKGG